MTTSRTIQLCTNDHKIILPEKGDPYWETPRDHLPVNAMEELLIEKILELEDHHQSLKKSLTSGLFADRDTICEAYDYAIELLRAQPDDNPAAPIYTALHVLMNTIAGKI